MKKYRQIVLVLFFSVFTFTSPRVSEAADPPDAALIKGTTDFLLDRAYDKEPPRMYYGTFLGFNVGLSEADKINNAVQVILELVKGLNKINAACKDPERGMYTGCLVEITGLLKTAARAEYVLYCRRIDLAALCVSSERKLKMHI